MKIEKTNLLETIQKANTAEKKETSGIEEGRKQTSFTIDKEARKSGLFGNAVYHKPKKDAESTIEDIADEAEVMDATQMKNEMLFGVNTTTEKDYEKMQEDGFSLHNTEVKTVVTVTDKIKMHLAKAGKDISGFGEGLSKDQLEAMTGTAAMAQMLSHQLAQADLPMTADNLEDAKEAADMAAGLVTPTDGAVKYMLDNELEPTIENLYKAEYSGSAVYHAQEEASIDYDRLMSEIAKTAEQAGLSLDEGTIADSKWLIENEIPLTPENLSYYRELKNLEIPQTDDVVQAMVQAITEGKRPQDGMLIAGYSMADRAADAAEVIENVTESELAYLIENEQELTIENLKLAQGKQAQEPITPGSEKEMALLTARRQLEETRLAMTAQANYALLKQGISIDTKPLSELVDALKEQENSYYQNLLNQGGIEATAENVAAFRETIETIDALREVPAATLDIKTVDEETLSQLYETGRSLKDTYEKAGQQYETLMTSPRKDMGDTIQKAFANVDDILTDLNLQTSPENERAVRILAYNSQEITEENILKTKAADEAVQRAFHNMTPSVVREMIKEGSNPLNMTIEELNEKAVEIKEDLGIEEEERFSKYLWKIEQNEGISEEERSAYIGIYRLIRQVEKTDGAAIGALLEQGSEITMQNLLTQVRNAKHEGKEYTVDDEFGGVNAVTGDSPSIIDQIEKGYQTNCVHDVIETMTPEKMGNVMSDENWQEMSPEELARKLSGQEETELDQAYAREQLSEFAACAKTSEEVYQMLERYDIPNTMYHVLAAEELLKNRNKAYQSFFENHGSEEKDIDLAAIKEEIFEQFAESIKTPEEMAKAQKALADTAENVMKTMIIENENITTLDIRQMKLLNAQISIGIRSAEEETYAIPVLIGDEVTNVSLKIVRGKETKGMVDILFSTDSLGKVAAQLKADGSKINGYVVSDQPETIQKLTETKEALEATLSTGETETVSLQFMQTDSVNLNTFGKEDRSVENREAAEEEIKIQTKTLYHMAEAFLRTVKSMQS